MKNIVYWQADRVTPTGEAFQITLTLDGGRKIFKIFNNFESMSEYLDEVFA